MGHAARLFLGLLFLAATLRAGGILPRNGDKVAFLGDGLTADGWNAPGGYVRLVVAGLKAEGVEIVPLPAGVAGESTQEQIRRLDPGLLKQKPNWVVLFPGQADVRRGVLPEDFHRNVFSLVDETQARKANVLLVTAPPLSEGGSTEADQRIAADNEFLRGLARERNYALADVGAVFAKALQADPPWPGSRLLTVLGPNGFQDVRLNPAGNRLVALAILQAWGVPPDDFAKIQEAWNQIPAAAPIGTGFQPVVTPLSFAQYDALIRAAKARRVANPDALAAVLYVEAVKEALAPFGSGAYPELGKLQYDIQKRFADKIVAAAKAAPEKWKKPSGGTPDGF